MLESVVEIIGKLESSFPLNDRPCKKNKIVLYWKERRVWKELPNQKLSNFSIFPTALSNYTHAPTIFVDDKFINLMHKRWRLLLIKTRLRNSWPIRNPYVATLSRIVIFMNGFTIKHRRPLYPHPNHHQH